MIFWSQPEEHLSWPAEQWAVYRYDADGVHEVLAWTAHEVRPHQTYTVHIARVARLGKSPDLL